MSNFLTTDDPIPAIYTEDRTFGEYCRMTHVDLAQYAGKRILDIGSGTTARFAQEAADEYGVTVISLNPNWKVVHHVEKPYIGPVTDGQYIGNWVPSTPIVAATSANLPFLPDSFDAVTAVYSVPHYLPDPKYQSRTFQQMQQVLRPGAKAYIAPADKLMNPTSRKMLGNLFADVTFDDEFYGVDATKPVRFVSLATLTK